MRCCIHTNLANNLFFSFENVGRAVNVRSVDKASRREPPLVTASRNGQTDCVKLLLGCLPELDIERKDGQGRTALWHAVQEQRDDVVALLVEAGARIFYEGMHGKNYLHK